MEREEQIAIEVLETIMNGNSNPRNLVSTTIQNFSFTYEDLMSDRTRAYFIKKSLMSKEEITMFKILRRRLLSRKYSRTSRHKKRTYAQQIKSERCTIVTKAYELFSDHPKIQEFREFIQTLDSQIETIAEKNDSNTIMMENTKNDVPNLVAIDSDDYSDDDVPDLIDTSKLQEIK